MPAPIIVWFRQDLRVSDHPALDAASREGPVIPLFILDDRMGGAWSLGSASRWWLKGSLSALADRLAMLGTPLLLRRGESVASLVTAAKACGARAIYWNRHYEPYWRQAEDGAAAALQAEGVTVRRFAENLLFPSGSILGRGGQPLRVFSPFWKACLAAPAPATPLPSPRSVTPATSAPAGDDLRNWQLRPVKPDWATGLCAMWQPGEQAGLNRLDSFIEEDLETYGQLRDRPEPSATSRLSPYLHFGDISPRQVWHRVRAAMEADSGRTCGGEAFLRELGWREFTADVLAREPKLADEPIKSAFAAFPWSENSSAFRAWQCGATGYPIVDAGMRQLWQTGWMHNRVRMIAASFLVKHLLIPWQQGEAWFWDTLVDADLANNAGGWQWVAGCGVDASPYFRIFNPVLQGEKFDPDGAYVRRWLPELAGLPNHWIHRPWNAPPLECAAAGLRLGSDYPQPLVDHNHARHWALKAFNSLKAQL